MKRALSVILTLAMVISMCAVMFATNAAAATVITNTSPAITADVGEKINLSSYSVTFDGDSSATSGVTWKNGSTTITEFTPSSKGVTQLTATSGTKTKTIYVVAKNANESEYVLYEAALSDYTVDGLKSAGWTLPSSGSGVIYEKASDGAFVIGHENQYGTTHAYLPQWLGDFGDYSITADVKITALYQYNGADDTSRWFSITHHSNNLTASPTFYQCCIRANGGIECAERVNTTASWGYLNTSAISGVNFKSAYHSINVQTYQNTFAYSVDGNVSLHVDSATYNSKATVKTSKGYIGLSMNGGSLAVKSIKVTVMETAPEKELNVVKNSHEDLNLISPIANVEMLGGDINAAITANDAPGSVFVSVSALTDVAGFIKTCMEKDILPTFMVEYNSEADKLLNAVASAGCKDVNVVSSAADILTYIHGKNTDIRLGLYYMALDSDTLDSESAHAIRAAARGADASFIVINEHYTKQVVSELQELGMPVWAATVTEPESDDFTIEVMEIVTSGVNGIITVDASAVAEIINTNMVENSMPRTPVAVGHRGNPSQVAQNTIESFRRAYENGADLFELDIRITGDNQIIVLHDGTLNATTNYTGTKSVSAMTVEEIKQYNIKVNDTTVTDLKVPTFEEVLKEFQNTDIRIMVEFKGGGDAKTVQLAADLIKKYGMEDRVCTASNSLAYVAHTRTYLPSVSTGCFSGSVFYADNTEITALDHAQQYLAQITPTSTTINPARYVIDTEGYFVQAMTDRGIMICPWTYSGSLNNFGFMSGIDTITLDDSEWLTDMAKSATAVDFKMNLGQSYVGGSFEYLTYGRDIISVPVEDTVYSVLTGDSVKVENGRLVAVSEGKAVIVMGYKARTTGGSEYVVYSQPITVTVVNGDLETLEKLSSVAMNMDTDSLSEENAEKFIANYNDTCNLIDNGSTDAEAINAAAKALSESILTKPYYTVLKVESYTTTEPNYYMWDGSLNNGAGGSSDKLEPLYVDDGKRLIDGNKYIPAGNSTAYVDASGNVGAYSAWQSDAEVILNLGEAKNSNVYRAYFTGGPWGVSVPSDMKIYYSNDQKSWTAVDAKVVINTITEATSTVWGLYEYVVASDELVNACYIKYEIARKGSFVWVGEVEAVLYTGSEIHNHEYTDDWQTDENNHWQECSCGEKGNKATHTEGKWETEGESRILRCAVCGYIMDIKETTGDPENPPAPDDYVLGDINNNGSVDMTDYILAKRAYFGTYKLTEDEFKRGNVNFNEEMDMTDYILIKRVYFGTYSFE